MSPWVAPPPVPGLVLPPSNRFPLHVIVIPLPIGPPRRRRIAAAAPPPPPKFGSIDIAYLWVVVDRPGDNATDVLSTRQGFFDAQDGGEFANFRKNFCEVFARFREFFG